MTAWPTGPPISRSIADSVRSTSGIDATVHSTGVPTLDRLLRTDRAEGEQAWADFLSVHSRLLLHACRQLSRDPEAAMDAYAHILESLHADDCRRLRAYVPDGRTRFTTWLVVVARRLFLDWQRHRYGRPRSAAAERQEESHLRQRIEDLVGDEIDVDQLASAGKRPDADIRRRELMGALATSIAMLPPSDRLLLALRFQDERPIREIAAVLGLRSVFHVYRRLNTVLGVLRNELALRGVRAAEP
jgi:RNA polymerase sigma factor (sigma-70 family)